MVSKISKKKAGRPALEFIYNEPKKVEFRDISIPMQIAFVFSWSMIAVLITVFIKSLL